MDQFCVVNKLTSNIFYYLLLVDLNKPVQSYAQTLILRLVLLNIDFRLNRSLMMDIHLKELKKRCN